MTQLYQTVVYQALIDQLLKQLGVTTALQQHSHTPVCRAAAGRRESSRAARFKIRRGRGVRSTILRL